MFCVGIYLKIHTINHRCPLTSMTKSHQSPKQHLLMNHRHVCTARSALALVRLALATIRIDVALRFSTCAGHCVSKENLVVEVSGELYVEKVRPTG
ncbi:hypothetical protein JAAARDRAFT_556182 [Jaapia argillacea MUCL 33604]|uniref:Uncharacterized protein n=1 Tax=Jaapia argillacea MUCL 33604 TaxID=933084 RepID=A0A067QAU7_9AGAM|nr:hypothetical protein JAAARDRAFT_556182 [Jaapia argillacea MUCL 33604]